MQDFASQDTISHAIQLASASVAPYSNRGFNTSKAISDT